MNVRAERNSVSYAKSSESPLEGQTGVPYSVSIREFLILVIQNDEVVPLKIHLNGCERHVRTGILLLSHTSETELTTTPESSTQK